MKYDYHVVVLGAGSAGLVVASGAVSLGAKVALIEADKMGGDCLNAGCVPSKSFLKSAHFAGEITNAEELGLNASMDKVDLSKVMKRVKQVINDIAPHDSVERYEKMGVKVFSGQASFIDKHTVQVGQTKLTAKHIVIATGSEPVVPPIKGLDTINYLTNRNIFDLKELPEHLIVLGGGPIGLELGQGFAQLGAKVSVIDMNDHLFGKDDPEVAPILEKQLQQDGVELLMKSKILEVKKIKTGIEVIIEKDGKQSSVIGDQVLVSLGRRPVSKNLGLEKVGIQTDKRGFVTTNAKLQSAIKHIYACGDVTGPYQFTHMAGYQAGIVIRNIVFRMGAKVDYSSVPWTTYTKPEVAHVGYTEPWAKSLGLYHDKVLVDLNEMDRAKADNDTNGFLKLILNKKSIIIGATFVGDKTGEMIPLATLAIKQKLKATAFLGMIFSYPTEAEIFKFASLAKVREGFKPWQKNLIQKILLR